MPRPTFETREEIEALLDTRTYPQNFSLRCFELKLRPHEYIQQKLAEEPKANGSRPIITDELKGLSLQVVRALRKKYNARYQEYGWPRQGDWANGQEDISPELLFYLSVWSSLTATMSDRESTEAWDVVNRLLGLR
jgi:hypothetical protein